MNVGSWTFNKSNLLLGEPNAAHVKICKMRECASEPKASAARHISRDFHAQYASDILYFLLYIILYYITLHKHGTKWYQDGTKCKKVLLILSSTGVQK